MNCWAERRLGSLIEMGGWGVLAARQGCTGVGRHRVAGAMLLSHQSAIVVVLLH